MTIKPTKKTRITIKSIVTSDRWATLAQVIYYCLSSADSVNVQPGGRITITYTPPKGSKA